MGGKVGIIIKNLSNKQIAMSRWTNVLPDFFSDASLFVGSIPEQKKWNRNFLKMWREMKKDYEENKETGNFKLPMTETYFPHEGNIPTGYGLVAVDMLKKKIYSSQDYCYIGAWDFSTLLENQSLRNYNRGSKMAVDKQFKNLKKFFELGAIKGITFNADIFESNPQYENKDVNVDISVLSWDELHQFILESVNSKVKKFSHPLFHFVSEDEKESIFWDLKFIVDTEWEFFTFPVTCNGIIAMKKKLEEDGFKFTNSENEAWKEYQSQVLKVE